MMANYNPFSKKEVIDTQHGRINYHHDMGTTYVTHRTEEHVFKKYQGFGISNTELETCYNERVHWILIIYHNEKKGTSIAYRIKLKETKYLPTYHNGNDTQTMIPIRKMQERKQKGEWE